MGMRHFISITIILLVVGCETPPSTESYVDIPISNDLAFLTSNKDSLPIAICLWKEVKVYESPGVLKESEPAISSVLLGDQVFMLGPSKRVLNEKRSYMKIRLADGSEGWVPAYHFGKEARSAVITQTSSLYRRPDPLMIKKDYLQTGDFVAVVDEEKDWVKVLGKEKEHVGWIQKDPGLSERPEDIRVAVMFQRARSETELSRKVSLLENILEYTEEGSSFLPLIEADLMESSKQMDQEPSLNETDPTQITAVK